MTVRYDWARFNELSVGQLYALLRLRAEVFVLEQHCPFVDPDGLDPEAWHLLAWEGEGLVGCARIFLPRPGSERVDGPGSVSASRSSYAVSVGRVVTSAAVRGTGLGRALMHETLRWIAQNQPAVPVRLGAQARLRNFYESFGFAVSGAAYLEDGIAHIPMEKPA